MHEIKSVNLKGWNKTQKVNRLSLFFVQTINYLADPTIQDKLIPVDIFEIGEMLSNKIKDSDSFEFFTIQRYAKALLNNPKYKITLDYYKGRTTNQHQKKEDSYLRDIIDG